MKKVINTGKSDPETMLHLALVLGGDGFVERQEAEGQESFVESDTLPKKSGLTLKNQDDRKILESFGFQFLGDVQGDDLFEYVKLPPGWSKKPTDHSMWSKIVDDQGRERVLIFYKAAFYDRDAFYRVCSRFSFRRDFSREKEGLAVAVVTDCDIPIHTTEPIKLPAERGREYFRLGDAALEAALTWLLAHYPDFRNPGAYWRE